MTTLTWKRDGDQHAAIGTLGVYRISESRGSFRDPTEACFQVTVRKPGGDYRHIAESSELKNAKRMAAEYDGYRAQPKSYSIAGFKIPA